MIIQPNTILWSAPAATGLERRRSRAGSASALDSSSQDRWARVHVWAARMDLKPAALAALSAMLSANERERAARFHFEQHRNRFIAGRGFLRIVLRRYLRSEPLAVEFDYGPHGKPALAGRLAETGLHFNLAHSED